MNKLVIGFAVLAMIVPQAVIAQGARSETVSRGRRVVDATPAGPGILVSRVIPDSPAEAAGIIRGDIILAIDGEQVDFVRDLRDLLSNYEAGDEVEALLSRGTEEITISITLETRLYRPAIGIESAPAIAGPGPRLPEEMRLEMFESMHPGDIVRAVAEGSPAEAAGLMAGDIIVRFGDSELDEVSVGDAVAEASPGDVVEIEVLRPAADEPETVVLSATLGENEDGEAFLGISYFPLRRGERMLHFPDGRMGGDFGFGRRVNPPKPLDNQMSL